jgi:hypothetical protein
MIYTCISKAPVADSTSTHIDIVLCQGIIEDTGKQNDNDSCKSAPSKNPESRGDEY